MVIKLTAKHKTARLLSSMTLNTHMVGTGGNKWVENEIHKRSWYRRERNSQLVQESSQPSRELQSAGDCALFSRLCVCACVRSRYIPTIWELSGAGMLWLKLLSRGSK
ncbi:hypothetical protein AAFF_G00395960 [Aldrovandia affinis]|uniref:Uncharacterized protein n=1 Tax=Aldrovandia affinis TaxID=143900 RepID=A0AAD7SD94_9TELE|nr:hypothetical protein AAFF_G00395960 [Aldrovandia affinis]